MKTVEVRHVVAVAMATTLLLAGCTASPTTGAQDDPGAPPVESSSDDSVTDDSGTEESSGSGADCGIFDGQTDPELMLFTSTAIESGPSEGQVYGDGTELSVTLSQEAIDAGLLPQFELLTLSPSGGPVLISSLIFDRDGVGRTYSTTSLEFGDDELVGTAIVAKIFAISDAVVGDAQPYGDKLLLGNYCMTYANDGS